MDNQIQVFENPKFGKLRCYIGENNTAYFNAEDVAYGLGFVDYQEKLSATNGRKTYEVVRWARINGYLKEFGYYSSSQQVGKNDYIPENMVYRLAMKAKNETAEDFQAWLADDVVPAIRKHGAYITPATLDNLLSNPDFAIRLFTELKNERDKNLVLTEENAVLNQQVAELTPKADYYDLVMNCPTLLTITDIAKDYGMSAKEFNQKLNKLGIQFQMGKTWYLYQKYAKKGWTQTVTLNFNDKKGGTFNVVQTRWTQKGRLGLYNELKQLGILPLIEVE